ncbi:hypothetical protein Pmani_031830 [Petrolisthes manimaculis]|uniref:NADH dehydrogenase [ubiquinone] 1 subunit C2 n=1 Tax=Petrolisthes manimaculis TaxID=1843537 RepID=A0AAE1NUX2_9EUCA|nr:hypothetical protein Pmani_031830 [Petrolisthes manimaculis]
MEEEKLEINPADYFSPTAAIPARGTLRDYYYPVVCGGIGFVGAMFMNFFARKPVFSGIQQHMIAGSLGVVTGFTLDRWMDRRGAHRDAVLYNYIVTHPEDFPPIRRKKYAEVLESWTPIR